MENPEFGLPQSDWKRGRYLEWYVDEPLVARNGFLRSPAEAEPPPSFADSRKRLPQPTWPANPLAIQAYWKAWELAWSNLRSPAKGSGFVSDFIDTAFNDCLFLWDSAFILRFGHYGERAFAFHKTLDNFYAKQHRDGYICRELHFEDGTDQWHRTNPFATGPNVLAWAEWKRYEASGDLGRLAAVYPAIAAYHRWTRKNRTWPDGSYWTTGLGCGMDNMHRVPKGVDTGQEHGWLTWTDATFQAILSGRLLAKMAEILGIADEIGAGEEAERLAEWVNTNLWDDAASFYFDRDRDGSLLAVKSVAAYWALLAGIVPPDRLGRFVSHLSDRASFNRHHRVPSLSADSRGYAEDGDYWNGAIWPPTNYMILSGLTEVGRDDLAYSIAQNHYDCVLEVFRQTGTFWENYSPESSTPGQPARRDFVGWSGLPPIAVLLEYVFGIRPVDALNGGIVWDIRLTDEFGVVNYPLGPTATVSLHCAARSSVTDEPSVTIQCDQPLKVEMKWKNGSKHIQV